MVVFRILFLSILSLTGCKKSSVNLDLKPISNMIEVDEEDDDTVLETSMNDSIIQEIIRKSTASKEEKTESLKKKISFLFNNAEICHDKFKVDLSDLQNDACGKSHIETYDYDMTEESQIRCVYCRLQFDTLSEYYISIQYSESSHSTVSYYLTTYRKGVIDNIELLGNWHGSESMERELTFSVDGNILKIVEEVLDRRKDYNSPKLSSQLRVINLDTLIN